MKLRTRFLLGQSYLVGLLVVTATVAALAFFGLSGKLDLVLEENYRSIQSALVMLESLERQDSVLLARFLEPDQPTADLTRSHEAFEAAFASASQNRTLQEEEVLLDEIRSAYEGWSRSSSELRELGGEEGIALYRSAGFEHFEAAKGAVVRLLEANQRAMFEAEEKAREEALQTGVALGMLVVIAVLSLAYFSHRVQHDLLGRLDVLRNAAQAIAGGDRHRRLRVDRRDELGLVAQELNNAVDREMAIEARLTGQLMRAESALRGILASFTENGALFSLEGRPMARVGAVPDEKGLFATLSEKLEEASLACAEGQWVRFDLRGERLRCRLIHDGDTPVAWYLEPDPEARPALPDSQSS